MAKSARQAVLFDDRFLKQVFSLATGYADGNDAGRLAADRVLKTLWDRGPASDADLASQPTLPRFENAPSARDLLAGGRALERHVVARLAATGHGSARCG